MTGSNLKDQREANEAELVALLLEADALKALVVASNPRGWHRAKRRAVLRRLEALQKRADELQLERECIERTARAAAQAVARITVKPEGSLFVARCSKPSLSSQGPTPPAALLALAEALALLVEVNP